MRKFVGFFVGLSLILNTAANVRADNVVTRWVEEALDIVRLTNTGTPVAGRWYAMTTVAMYDAVNGIDRARFLSTREQALVPPTGAPLLGDRRAAVAAAAHAVLVALAPSQATNLDAALATELASFGGTGNQFVVLGRNWGAAVGAQVVSLRAADGTQASETQPGITGIPGQFPRNFSPAQYRNMVPFGIDSIVPYASAGPPALTSAEYAAAFNEVKVLGSNTDPDPERTAIARQWLAEANTARETGLWLKAAINIVEAQHTDLFLSATARLFALLGMSIADAVATSWTAKFDFHYWRPGDAIRAADPNVNPDTVPDVNWSPRGTNVPSGATGTATAPFGGTPEHTSGTSTFAGAASTILAGFYCRDNVAFSFAGEQPSAPERSYQSFSQAADEAGRSRIYGGIHFEFSNQAGQNAGDGVGHEVVTTRLRRAGQCFGIFCQCPQL